jgi:5'-nucleotidase (lipoprotein e(P4) family)
VQAHEPANVQITKDNAIKYVTSGEYHMDITTKMQIATHYLQKRICNNQKHKKLAVVLDVDETCLSNFQRIQKYDFAKPPGYLHDTYTYNHTPIIPVLNFYKFAEKNKIATFFITGRPEKYRQATIKNLHLAGYKKFNHLYLEKHKYKSASIFKTAIRKQITQQGYDIVLNIGDQYSDLKGSYADMKIKLPNPFYFCP